MPCNPTQLTSRGVSSFYREEFGNVFQKWLSGHANRSSVSRDQSILNGWIHLMIDVGFSFARRTIASMILQSIKNSMNERGEVNKLSLSLSLCLSVSLSLSLCLSLSVCLSVCLSLSHTHTHTHTHIFQSIQNNKDAVYFLKHVLIPVQVFKIVRTRWV